MPEPSSSRVRSFMDRLLDEAIVQSVLHEVGEKSTQVAKEVGRHMSGLGLIDENLERRSEQALKEMLIGVDDHTAEEIHAKFNDYWQWILDQSNLPDIPSGANPAILTEPELKWRAKMWGLVVTAGDSEDDQKRIIKGLAFDCQDDDERERYLMSLMINKPVSLKAIHWLKRMCAELMAWLRREFGPNIATGVWRRIKAAVTRIWDDFLDFVEADFIPWLTATETRIADFRQTQTARLEARGGFSLLGDFLTQGPFFRR